MKTNSSSAGRAVTGVSASLTNPLPDCYNYSLFCHTHYLIIWINTSLVSWARTFTKQLCWRLTLHCCSALLQNRVLGAVLQCLEEAEQQAEPSGDVPPLPLQIVISTPFCLFLFLSICLCSLSQSSLFSLSSFPLASPPSLLSLLINYLSS